MIYHLPLRLGVHVILELGPWSMMIFRTLVLTTYQRDYRQRLSLRLIHESGCCTRLRINYSRRNSLVKLGQRVGSWSHFGARQDMVVMSETFLAESVQ